MLNQLKENSLPNGYISYNYLISGGGAYIDTGIKLSNNDVVYIDIHSTQTANGFFIGAEDSDNSFRIEIINYWFNISVNDEVLYKEYKNGQVNGSIIINNGNIYYNNKIVANGITIPTITTNLYLFANNKNGVAQISNGNRNTLYIKRFRVTGNNNIDMIPCENEEGEKGMYDLIKNTFYGNQNQGNDFIVE